MAKAIETLSIKLEFKDDAGTQQLINKINASFKGLGQVISGNTKPAIQKLRNEINTFAATGNTSISTIESQVTALRALRREADINSSEFRQLTADISKFEKQLAKTEGRRRGGGGAIAATQAAGAVISGGIFGGVEGLVGGIGGLGLGAALGAPVAGAFAGAAVGAQIGMIRQAFGGVAETVAEINSMKIALAGVSESAEDYQKSFKNVIDISKQFLFPVDKAIGEFTKLKAAVVGAGFGTEEATDVFKGFAAAILATGGNSEKLSGALLAASQVFSKGKVQAEELRGQIGERLPGAFTTFAQSIGVSSRELDDMLRKGEVSTENFVEFTRTLFSRYEKTAETLGSSPEKAGQRLELALSLATLEYGGFFQKVGAGFQDYLTNLVNFATKNKQNFINIAADVAAFAADVVAQLKNAAMNIATPFIIAFSALEVKIENLKEQFGLLFKAAEAFGKLLIRADGFDGFDLPPSGRPSVQERATAIRNQLQDLFAQFDPTSFGTSLGDTPLPTGGADGADGGANAVLSKMKTTSQELVDISNERTAAFTEGNKVLVAQLDYKADIQRISERFNAGEIDFNTARDLSNKAHNKLVATGLRLRREEQRNLAKMSDDQDNLNKKLTDAQKLYKQLGNTIKEGFGAAIEGLVFQTKSLAESLNDLLKSLASMFIQFGIKQAFTALGNEGGFLGELFGNANGNVIAKNKIVPYARGGIVNKPTLFPLANGTGLMGEAGPEAILPLRRGPSGRLGVESTGSVGDIIVNVDASGSNVEGDEGQSKALGQAHRRCCSGRDRQTENAWRSSQANGYFPRQSRRPTGRAKEQQPQT